MLFRRLHSRHLIWLLVLCPLLALLHVFYGLGYDNVVVRLLPGLSAHRGQHPIEELVQQSKQRFRSMIDNQSRTYEEAVGNYQKRYNMDPPRGFEGWFEFAKEKNSLIIDDYDTIFDSVSPLLRFPPEVLQMYMNETAGQSHISRCGFRDGKLVGDCGPRGETVQDMTAPYRHALPDLELLVNSHDEPTVILSADDNDPVWSKPPRADAKKYITRPCDPTHHPTARNHTSNLPLIQDISESKDVCAHPEYQDMHGFLISPTSFDIASKPVPILSQAKVSTFNDILMPSQIYLQSYTNQNNFGLINDTEHDPEWEQKESKLYWIGSNTGGQDVDSSWHDMHRQRFVALAGNYSESETNATYLEQSPAGVWTPQQSRNLLPTLTDVHFTAIIQCASAECKAQNEYFHPVNRQPKEEQYRNKFLMDLDGNSYSGRFYAHLRSRSLSLKMTVFQEWHDDRLFPWVHYVPVSLSMEELPELVRFFATTERGMEIGREIADLGREWWGKLLRAEDFQVYFYRLLLELARLLDDERVVDRT